MQNVNCTCAAVCSLVLLLTLSSQAQQETLLDSVAKGCEQELTTYCKDVTHGSGRIFACLYAYGDKLSNKCEFALYDVSIQLERAITAVSFAIEECADDLDTHCSDVAAGEGRLIECLEKHEQEVSARCKEAFEQVGLK